MDKKVKAYINKIIRINDQVMSIMYFQIFKNFQKFYCYLKCDYFEIKLFHFKKANHI